MTALELGAVQVRYVNKSFWRNPASAFFTFALPRTVCRPATSVPPSAGPTS
jgi:hypothetical protein